MNNSTAKTITAVKFFVVFTLTCAFVLSHVGQARAQRRSSKQPVRQNGKQSNARLSTSVIPARLVLSTGEIQTENLNFEPQAPVILGRMVRGVFEPSNYVEFPNLARKPNPKWSPGWIELKTGKIHSDVKAVKPRKPFLRGRIAPNNRFYVNSKDLKKLAYMEESEEWGANLSFRYYPIMEKMRYIKIDMPAPEIVPQFLPESWTLTENGDGSIEIASPDNQAVVTVDINDADFPETDILEFAKKTEKEILGRFDAYRQLSFEPASVFNTQKDRSVIEEKFFYFR